MESLRRDIDDAIRLGDKKPDTARKRLFKSLRSILPDALPDPLPGSPHLPKEHPTPSEYAALNYTLAAELVRAFLERETSAEALVLSRGQVLDIWDLWWKQASGLTPDKVSRSPTSPARELGTGYIIDPQIVCSSICVLDDGLALIISDGVEVSPDEVHRQGRWLLARLHRTDFSPVERVVLYEFLRLRHWRYADRCRGLIRRTVETIISAARSMRKCLDSFGEVPMPLATDRAFDLQRPDPEADLMLEVVQMLRSCAIEGVGLIKVGERLLECAHAFGIDTTSRSFPGDTLSARDVDALVHRLAVRSRMIRFVWLDLFGYRFAKPSSLAPATMEPGTGCDCWVSLVGNPQAGKTTFTRSLVAALMPDQARFNDDPKKENSKRTVWTDSRVRLLEPSDFNKCARYGEIFDTDLDERMQEAMRSWCGPAPVGTTPTGHRHIAEVRTGQLARLRFYDIAGEEIKGRLDDDLRHEIRGGRLDASIYIDAEDRRDDPSSIHWLPRDIDEAFTERGPVYIVFNKADQIESSYSGPALEEMRRSFGCVDKPMKGDADFEEPVPEPFFSTRHLGLTLTKDSTHRTVLDRLVHVPSIARRPWFHERLRRDIRALSKIVDALLAAGRSNISFLYLTSIPNGRTSPADFGGIRALWRDLEGRVLQATRAGRRRWLRRLLVDQPKAGLFDAHDAFSKTDILFPPGASRPSTSSPGASRPSTSVVSSLEHWATEFEQLEGLCGQSDALKAVVNAGLVALKEAADVRVFASNVQRAISVLLPELGFSPELRQSQIVTHLAAQRQSAAPRVEQGEARDQPRDRPPDSHPHNRVQFDFYKGVEVPIGPSAEWIHDHCCPINSTRISSASEADRSADPFSARRATPRAVGARTD